MRRALFRAAGVTLALGAIPAWADDTAWRSSSNAMTAPAATPAVSLGAPTVSLGAPRSANVVPVSAIGGTTSSVFRAKADEKQLMPPGPALSGAPASAPATVPLPPPTPLSAPMTVTPGMQVSPPGIAPPPGGFLAGPESLPPQTGIPGGDSCGAACGCDGFAPLPGGMFVPEMGGCGYLLWGRAEYLGWVMRDSHLPTLLTTGTPAQVMAGGGTVLIGDNSVTPQERSGARFTVGGWFNRCQNWGLEGSYFFLAQRGSTFEGFAPPAGSGLVLARPFTNVSLVNGVSVARPDVEIPNTFQAVTESRLWGGDINLRKSLLVGCRSRLDGLIGFRYLDFEENIKITETFGDPVTRFVPGFGPALITNGMLEDNFAVRNRFYGGQIGLTGELRRGSWSLEGFAKVAFGTTQQTVTNSGGQMFLLNNVPVTGPGLLVQPSNAGEFSRNQFSVVPEAGLTLGYYVTPNIKLFGGYNFLYWSNVLRAADQIDTTLNVSGRFANGQLPPLELQPTGPQRPVVPFRSTDFWAQGVTVGIQFTW